MSGFERLLIGRTVGGHYQIDGVLGDGGFGVVFRATDLRPGRAERAVALKILKVPVRATEEELLRLRARFRHEAAFAARLPSHPGIVPIYDYGTDPALERDYLVMELLEGEDLRARLARPEPLPLSLALRLLRDAGRALAVGHAAGLIHRDVKPGNLFLCRGEGGEVEVRVLDFGIAKSLLEDAEQTATHVTRDGRAPLSGRYAAPEQLRGEALSCAADVFALGVVGFEVLTRTRLYTDADQSRRELGLPVPVPSLRARNPEIPAEVEAVVVTALADDPRARYPDAAAFARALQQACGRLRVPPEPLPGRVRWRRRLPALTRRAAAAAVAAGVLVMGGSMAMQLVGAAGAAPVAAEEVAPRLSPAAEAAQANREGLRLFRRREYGEALRQFRRAARLAPGEAEYRNNLGYTLVRLRRAGEAVQVLEEVVLQYPYRHVAYANLADAYLLRGDTTRAVETLEALLALDPPRARRELAKQVLARLPGSDDDAWAYEAEDDEEGIVVESGFLELPETDDPRGVPER